MKFRLRAKLVVVLVILVAIIVVSVFVSFSRKKNEYSVYKVERGQVLQEISETGTIKKGDKISLSFKTTGQIKELYVKIGKEVKKGDILAKLDNTQLNIQLQQAEADLELAEAELNKLLAGASAQEIQVARTSVDKAKTTLENEKKDLENVKATADQSLTDIYQDAFNTLNDSYLRSYNALAVVNSIQNTYFTGSDQDSLNIKEYRDNFKAGLDEMDFYLQKVEDNFSEQNIDFALVNFGKNLSDARSYLTKIRAIVEKPNFRNIVSSSDKTSLDTQRTNVNTAYTNVVSDQQDISSTKITNKTNIDTAQSAVASARDALKVAEDNLALVTAEPEEEDINLYQSKVKSAKARKDILVSQIQDTILKSPVDGTVTAVDKFAGETVQPASAIISILPSAQLEVEVDIYEEDVVKIEEGNLVKISLVAFPAKLFDGRVVFIEPAEKLVENIVYYTVSINFDTAPKDVKPGMTADIAIIVAQKDDVLVIPKEAVEIKDGRGIVKIFKEKKLEEKEIIVGLEGTNDLIEVISGLNEGEEIIID